MKDYALCSQEELEEKQRLLECRKENLMHMSRHDVNFSQEKLNVLYMEQDISESKMTMISKELGPLQYARYRINRIRRHLARRLWRDFVVGYFSARRLLLRLRLWLCRLLLG